MSTGTLEAVEILRLLPHLTLPRPNGSRALVQAIAAIQAWLVEAGIEVRSQEFMLRPFSMELVGLWLALTGSLLPVAALGTWGWVGLILVLFMIGLPVLEIRFLCPTISALVQRPARNLIVQFPARDPHREAILCAHIDSKTELLDHHQRKALVRLSPLAIGLALVCGALMVLQTYLAPGTPSLFVYWLAFCLSLPVWAYGLCMGANLFGGRLFRAPSSGAVDNGAAVAVLLGLAGRLDQGSLSLDHSTVTILLTQGEEAQMQGALAYVRHRTDWPLPTSMVNLEILGQNGGFVLWQRDGTAMSAIPVDSDLNHALHEAVRAVTGNEPRLERHQNSSDAFAFLRAGIPAATLGSYDADLGLRGFHSAQDNAGRVHAHSLREAVDVLSRFLSDMDNGRSWPSNAPVG